MLQISSGYCRRPSRAPCAVVSVELSASQYYWSICRVQAVGMQSGDSVVPPPGHLTPVGLYLSLQPPPILTTCACCFIASTLPAVSQVWGK